MFSFSGNASTPPLEIKGREVEFSEDLQEKLTENYDVVIISVLGPFSFLVTSVVDTGVPVFQTEVTALVTSSQY